MADRDEQHPARSGQEDLAAAWGMSYRGEMRQAHALAQAVRLRVQGQDDLADAEASWQLSWYGLALGEHRAATLDARRAVGLFLDGNQPARAAQAMAVLAWLLASTGEEDALDGALAAVDLADDDPVALCWVQNAVGIVYWLLRQHDLAQLWLRRAVDLARTLGDAVLLGRWLINLSLPLLDTGRRRDLSEPPADFALCWQSVRTLREAVTLLGRAGDQWGQRIALCNLVESYLEVGSPDQAARYLRDHDMLVAGMGEAAAPRALAHILLVKGSMWLQQGRLADALGALQDCLEQAAAIEFLEVSVPAAALLAEARAASGDMAGAFLEHKRFHALSERLSDAKAQQGARITASRHAAQELEERAIALETSNARLIEEAHRLAAESSTDALTGLSNRRGFEEKLSALAMMQLEFGLAMIDVDHFKSINDRFSHLVGDAVLRRIGGVLLGGARLNDHVVRYGGEEFAILLHDTTLERVAGIAERLRAEIAAQDWSDLHPELRVTVSIGVAASREAHGVYELLALADRRLYAAKAAGRNRVAAADLGGARRARLDGVDGAPA